LFINPKSRKWTCLLNLNPGNGWEWVIEPSRMVENLGNLHVTQYLGTFDRFWETSFESGYRMETPFEHHLEIQGGNTRLISSGGLRGNLQGTFNIWSGKDNHFL